MPRTPAVAANPAHHTAEAPNPGRPVELASIKQLDYLRSLIERRVIPTELAAEIGDLNWDNIEKHNASYLIGQLKDAPWNPPPKRRELVEGLYIQIVPGNDDVCAWLVRETKNGFGFNVKFYDTDADDWLYVGGSGSLPPDAHKASIEESLEFVGAFSRCSQCGLELHVKESREAAMGPHCRAKLGI